MKKIIALLGIGMIGGIIVKGMPMQAGSINAEAKSVNESAQTETAQATSAEFAAEPSTEGRVIEAMTILDVRTLPAGEVLTGEQLRLIPAESCFYKEEISDELFQRMLGKSYKENAVLSLEELCYIRVLHYGFDEKIHIGEMIVNKKISNDILDIFGKLYQAEYPIEKVLLIDDYDADDERSMSDNNTSAFNYRTISGSGNLSRHGMGMAVDINPLYNPYVKTVNGKMVIEPANSGSYTNRSVEFSYKIDENDLCYRLFTEYGFTWGGSWNSLKDYQHFEKKD